MNDFQLIAVTTDEVPAARTPVYRGVVENFINSDEQAARLAFPEGKDVTGIAAGLRAAVNTHFNEYGITVLVRKGQVYLVRS